MKDPEFENRINTNKTPRNAATCRGRYEKQAKGEFLMSDMLAVEQETNNDVRQFLNKINELRNKAPKTKRLNTKNTRQIITRKQIITRQNSRSKPGVATCATWTH